MDIYPYKFTPIYQERIWGGRNLARLFGRELPEDKTIGESWELADLAEGTSVVANGPLAGRTLTELTRQLGPALLGGDANGPLTGMPSSDAGKMPATREGETPSPRGRFPLLLKYLDAEATLSLQVHPDAEAARLIGGGAAPKTECWYVLESRGGFLYKGLRPGVTPETFREAIRSGEVEPLLQRFDVAAGDFHYLPAGTVHALGAGVVVAEVQTPSDTTYRVTDWGRGRRIHVEEAMQCIGFGGALGAPPGAAGDALVSSEHFRLTRRRCRAGESLAFVHGVCAAIMLLEGAMALSHAGAAERAVQLAAGDTCLLPAGLPSAEGKALVDSVLLEISPGLHRDPATPGG